MLKIKLIEHYQSILKIIDDLGHMLYPIVITVNSKRKKILARILASFVDNF